MTNFDKRAVFLEGERIALRTFTAEDVSASYLEWMNDQAVTRYMDSGTFPVTRQDLVLFYETVAKASNQMLLAIILGSSGLHIGNIKIGPINWTHSKATIGIMIGDKGCWGKGYATEAVGLVVEHAFSSMNLNRLELGVCSENIGAIRSYEKAGFRIEGRFRKSGFYDGRFIDGIWMGMLRQDWCKKKQ